MFSFFSVAPLACRQYSRQRCQQRRNSIGLCWLWPTTRHRIASLRVFDLQAERQASVRRASSHQHQWRQSRWFLDCQVRQKIQFGKSSCRQFISSPMGWLRSRVVRSARRLNSTQPSSSNKIEINWIEEFKDIFSLKKINLINSIVIFRPKNWNMQ